MREDAAAAPDLSPLLADPARAMLELDRLYAEESLAAYVRLAWPVLEPARPYIHGWVVDRVADHLEAVSRGEIKRLVINVPPGTSKSMVVSVLWPSWEWGPRNRPDLRYVLFAYAEALTIRDNRRCRNVIRSPLYQSLWGDRVVIDEEQNAKGRYDTTARGWRLAASVEGIGTGERGDRLLIDDPHSVKEVESEPTRESTLQWFSEVIPTRLNDPDRSAIVVIMQRTHARDVSGLILKAELGYEWLCLPMEAEDRYRCFTSVPRAGVEPEERALVFEESEPIPRWFSRAEVDQIPVGAQPEWQTVYRQDDRAEGELLWPERFSQQHVEEELKPVLRSWGGTYAEAGQLQQRPAPRGGGLFQRKDFQHFFDKPPSNIRKLCRGWDLAGTKKKKSPWTVGVKFALLTDGRLVCFDVVKTRGTPTEVDELILATTKSDGLACQQSIPQDPGQAGVAQKTHFAQLLHGFDVHFSPETGDKEVRARPLASQSEAGNFWLVRGLWTDSYIAELCSFPRGEFKDQADASSRAYARLLAKRDELIGAGPKQLGEEA